MKNLDKIIELSNKYEQYVISLRRELHRYPELAFNEFKTSQLIIQELEKLGIEMKTGIAGTGVMGIIKGNGDGKTILIRADMDALPIEEELDVSYRSENKGIMHACGHDVHTGNLLGAARILYELREEFAGTIKLLFQPGEERGGGAKKSIAEGILDDVDSAIGMHIMPIKEGQILLSQGNITAYSDGFTIKIIGKEAHTSKPNEGVDAINIAGHVIVALNSIRSKLMDPNMLSTFSIGKISGGTANNIVPNYVELRGMIRSITSDARELVIEKLNSISKGISESFGGECIVEVRSGYPSIYNDDNLTKCLRNTFKDNLIYLSEDISNEISHENIDKYVIEHKPLFTADDFGFIASKVPSVYYMVGTGNYAPAHSSKFFVDEDYIKLCTRTMVLAALKALE